MRVGSFTRRRGSIAVSSLVFLPILVKLPLLLGLLIANPAAMYGQITVGPYGRWSGLYPTLDPNIAFTSHALGTYAARSAIRLHSLWWNPLEGLGMPLAGEMQSAALFPLTWLMSLPNGQLLEQLLFQIIAGVSTFFLLRTLNVGTLGAWTAGVFFSFNGIFAWIANAVINPVCFLPLALLGIEQIFSGARFRGGVLTSLSLAASIYAGFPEVAYLDGLLIAVWVICRFFRGDLDRFNSIGWIAFYGLLGVLLAAPLLTAFADFLKVGNVGLHSDAMGNAFIRPAFSISVLLPYYFGKLYGQQFDFWQLTGGYAGVTLTILAIAGAFGSVDRKLRIGLAGWVLLTFAVSFGVSPFVELFHIIPLTRKAALFRYLDPSWMMAMCVLAGMAINDLRIGNARNLKSAITITASLVLVGVTGSAIAGLRPEHSGTTLISIAVQVCVLFGLLMGTSSKLPLELRLPLIAAVSAVEAIVLFAAPLTAYPYRAEMSVEGIQFLQRNLAFQRFVTLGPIAANYGSYFGIAEVNHNDLPVPSDWVDYAKARLDPKIDPITLQPVSAARLIARLPAYAALGTKYVVTAASAPLSGLTEVHVDRLMRIYAVPNPQPYVSAPNCVVRAATRTELSLNCSAPSVAQRLELYMAGWTASVNGHPVQVVKSAGVFQSVAVPAGRSDLHFDFLPPYVRLAEAAAITSFLVLLLSGVSTRRVGRHDRGLYMP